jgi:hypothetical protein
MQTAPSFAAVRSGHPIRRSIRATHSRDLRGEDHDLKLFVLSFTAFFVCIYSFIF